MAKTAGAKASCVQELEGRQGHGAVGSRRVLYLPTTSDLLEVGQPYIESWREVAGESRLQLPWQGLKRFRQVELSPSREPSVSRSLESQVAGQHVGAKLSSQGRPKISCGTSGCRASSWVTVGCVAVGAGGSRNAVRPFTNGLSSLELGG